MLSLFKYLTKTIAFMLVCISSSVWSALILNVDTNTEELYFTGFDSGTKTPGSERVYWEQVGWLPYNNQGVGLDVSGVTLNLNVSTSSNAIAVVTSELTSFVDLLALGQRVDYSWMMPEVKTILSNSNGVRLNNNDGSSFSPIWVSNVDEGFVFESPVLDYQTAEDVTRFWYENNYDPEFENQSSQLLKDALSVSIQLLGMRFGVPSSAGPLFEYWVSQIEMSVLGNARISSFGNVNLTTASPSLIYLENVNFDGIKGLSFDYDSLNISIDDLLVIKSEDEILYQLKGNDILLSGEVNTYFSNLSGYGNLSIGLYSDDSGHELSIDNFKLYRENVSVPEPASSFLFLSALIIFFIRRNHKGLN